MIDYFSVKPSNDVVIKSELDLSIKMTHVNKMYYTSPAVD